MKRLIKAERGSTLLVVLMVTVSLMLLGVALVRYSLSDRIIAAHQERDVTLYYIAEAGIEEGVAVKRRSFHHSLGFEGEIGEGRYEVSFVHIPDRGYKIVSTGYLGDKSLTLAVIVELKDLYEKALMVSDDLTIEEVSIRGNLHANDMFKIKKSNNALLPTLDEDGNENDDGYLTYSNHSQIEFIAEGEIDVRGEIYSSAFPVEWYEDPIPLPKIDYDSFVAVHDFCDAPGGNWNSIPDCYTIFGERHLRVNGDLTIKAATGSTIDFDGVLYVMGKLTLVGSGVGTGNAGDLNINGVIVATGDVFVDGRVNKEKDHHISTIVSERKVFFSTNKHHYDEYSPVFGGTVLIFAGDQVTVGTPSLDFRFNMYGTIIANHISLVKCNLTYIPDVATGVSQHFPGYGVVITEWIKP